MSVRVSLWLKNVSSVSPVPGETTKFPYNLPKSVNGAEFIIDKGEANLSKKSVVNITRIYTVDKNDLRERIGKVTTQRIREILMGIQLLTEPRE